MSFLDPSIEIQKPEQYDMSLKSISCARKRHCAMMKFFDSAEWAINATELQTALPHINDPLDVPIASIHQSPLNAY